MRQEQMDRDLLLEARQRLHVCFVWCHRCHCIIAMHLVSEVLGLIVGLYIRFHRMGSYNVYIINIIDNMHLICNWTGERFNSKNDTKEDIRVHYSCPHFTPTLSFLIFKNFIFLIITITIIENRKAAGSS